MEIKERAQRRFSIGNQLMLTIFALSLIFTVISSSISYTVISTMTLLV